MTSSLRSHAKKPWRAKSGICGQTSGRIRGRPIENRRAKYRNAHAVLGAAGFPVLLFEVSKLGQSKPNSVVRDLLHGNWITDHEFAVGLFVWCAGRKSLWSEPLLSFGGVAQFLSSTFPRS